MQATRIPTEKRIDAALVNLSCRNWIGLLILIVIATAIVRFMLPIRDGDIWFHLSYAEYFISHKTLIPDHSIYSWSYAVNTEHYCAWISELILYFVYKLGGISGLIIFRYSCVALFMFATIRYAKLCSIFWHPLTWLISLIAILMSYVAIYAKPEIFSWVCFTMMVWNWWYIRKKREKIWKNCYLFPLIVLFWVNSHGAFLIGLVFLCLIVISELLNTWIFPKQTLPRDTRRHLFISVALSVVAIVITPYGLAYPQQLFDGMMFTIGKADGFKNIAAYTSPLSVEARTMLFAYYINCAVGVNIYLIIRNWKKETIEASSIITTLCFVYLYTQYWRTTFFFAPVFLFSSLYLLHNIAGEQLDKYNTKKYLYLIVISIMIFLSVSTIYEGYSRPEKYLWLGFGLNEGTPVEELEYINANYPDKKIGNTYAEGSYFLWKRGPEKKVFIDGRYFPYISWIDEFWKFRTGIDVESFLSRNFCDVWVVNIVSNPQLLNWFLYSPEWKLDFYAKTSAIFVRKSIAHGSDHSVGKNINDIHNPNTARNVFVFACNAWDLTSAEKILSLVRRRFDRTHPSLTSEMTLFLDGLFAYRKGEYFETIEHFKELKRSYFFNESILMGSYSYVIGRLWKDNKFKQAAAFARKAYLENPNSLVNLYNLGAINGYLDIIGELKPSKDNDWKSLLSLFVETVSEKEPNNKHLLIAEKMLGGNFFAKPNIIIIVPVSGVPNRQQ